MYSEPNCLAWIAFGSDNYFLRLAESKCKLKTLAPFWRHEFYLIPLAAHGAADRLEPFPAVRVGFKTGRPQRRRRGRKQPTVKPWAGLPTEIQSARGLAQSKTLRAVRSSPGKRASVLD